MNEKVTHGFLKIFIIIAGLALATPSYTASAQEYEYEADEGLHQEEWYDPTDWFDTGAGIDYESDWNDFYYGYDAYDPWYRDDWTYNRHYGLGPQYGNQNLEDRPYDNNYYTEDWFNDSFDSWYEDNTGE